MNRLRAAWQRLLARLGLELDWSAIGHDRAEWCGTEWTVTRIQHGYIDGDAYQLDTTAREVHACALEPEHDGPCICDCGETSHGMKLGPHGWKPATDTDRRLTFTYLTGRNLL